MSDNVEKRFETDIHIYIHTYMYVCVCVYKPYIGAGVYEIVLQHLCASGRIG